MLILGVFVGVLAGIVFMKAFSAGTGAGRFDDPGFIGATDDRIRPIGRVALIGDPDVGVRPRGAYGGRQRERAHVGAAGLQRELLPLPRARPASGGAPVFGDAQAWAPRIAQGPEVLRQRVIDGYQGEVGVMPPKGGRTGPQRRGNP